MLRLSGWYVEWGLHTRLTTYVCCMSYLLAPGRHIWRLLACLANASTLVNGVVHSIVSPDKITSLVRRCRELVNLSRGLALDHLRFTTQGPSRPSSHRSPW